MSREKFVIVMTSAFQGLYKIVKAEWLRNHNSRKRCSSKEGEIMGRKINEDLSECTANSLEGAVQVREAE